MTETASIFKGDTAGPWRVAAPLDDGTLPTLPASYTCKIKVAGTLIDRAVTDIGPDDDGTANKRFLAALTPTETLTLEAGQYVVAIEIENTSLTPPLRIETHIILTVKEHIVGSAFVPTLPDAIADIQAELAAVRAARLAFMSGGAVKQAWSGRYGNRMTYDNPSLKDYNDMIYMLQRELEAAKNAECGLPARGRIGMQWAS
jgi:hypothetical protein